MHNNGKHNYLYARENVQRYFLNAFVIMQQGWRLHFVSRLNYREGNERKRRFPANAKARR